MKLDLRKLRTSYRTQRNRAITVRGIKFKLTFEEWLDIWVTSGHLHQRGKFSHQYCMARNGDKGAYEVGNVSIILVRENASQPKPWRSVIMKRKWKIKKYRKIFLANATNPSLETRAKMSASQRRRFRREKYGKAAA